MEDAPLRTNHSNLLQVQKEEIITTCSSDHKLENVERSTTSDVAILLNDNGARTAISPSTQQIPSVGQNEIAASLVYNKENVIRNETASFIGESHIVPNPYLTHQPLDQIDCNQYVVDPSTTSLCPPLMAYTNSLALSDISMPFPSLETSKSFGPSGILHNNNNAATTTQSQSRHGRKVCNLSHSQIHTPDNSYKVDMQYEQNFHEDGTALNDLNIAASALLDLTPAVTQNYPFDHAPAPINHHHHHVNPILRSRTVPSDNRAKKLPMMRQKHSVSIHLDGRATHENNQMPSRAHIESRAKDLLNEVPYTVQACKCKNTQCLKLYCTCFQQGTLCDELVCFCRKCENTAKHSKPRGSRTRAIYEILNRRIDAFDPRERKQTVHGCSCRKSKCLQKYCVCYAGSVFCDERCGCTGCQNKDQFDASSLPLTEAMFDRNESPVGIFGHSGVKK